ncbi:MAG: hypothetical protein K1060chlam2_01279 [Chlamydiae bacterium]|nr:hypothetical protein [Chlamydiota bacterium]
MAKKNFSAGIDAVLGNRISPTQRPKKLETVEDILEERTSIMLQSELLERLRAMAFWERSTIKTEVENAIKRYLNEKGDTIVEKALKHFREKKIRRKKQPS